MKGETLRCTFYPSGKHVWEPIVRNRNFTIYGCACGLQKSEENPPDAKPAR